MIAADLIEMLRGANPEAPVLLEYHGFVFEADAVEVQNGLVHIQGY